MHVLLIILALVLLPHSAAAETLHGHGKVTDGDTLRVGGVAVRLQGIAAPEMDESGGSAAKAYLRELAEGRTVVCALTGERTHGRRVGTCWVDSQDLAEAVIAAGLARDCPRFSGGRYAGVEQPEAAELPLPGYCRPRRR
ncbi:thermonuclease family protein [Geminicoccus harenae]|uniref:thermonuclease family protein n=1 Tax=Geminicoccus harenae TaxID=2498453 RepID=UPI00168AEC88|nr:thermonuclease family protein [Geminicoccus harenae]